MSEGGDGFRSAWFKDELWQSDVIRLEELSFMLGHTLS